MPEQPPSVVARLLTAVAGELDELGRTAAGTADLGTRLGHARELLSWARDQLPGDTPVTAPAEPETARDPTPAEITAYLRGRRPDSADEAHRVRMIRGGFSKRTILVSATLDGVGREVVLRQVPAGRKARSLAPEFAVVRALHEAGIPVPEPLWIEPEANALGGAFFVTARASGENFGDVWGGSGVSKEICAEIARIYARIHLADVHGVETPVSPRSTPDELRQTLDWQSSTLRKREITIEPPLASLFSWLRENIPANPGTASLLHGDAAFSNLLIEDGHVSAILDWEMAHFGDPAEELAYLRPSIEPVLPWEDFLDEYEQAGGRRPDNASLRFFEVWSHVWRHIGCLWLSQNFVSTGRYAAAVAAFVHGPRFLQQALRSAFPDS
ncbi:phosphotransferase family protein [Amycolatopsis acidicola]|uniref:Phosphotransferase family protein n=1 Tax=Amycolatopsis acidicola TaxID=2596893 RepID=A0A5N0V2C2_9PSEU|nr:phosphotransferase family protein [Amycolatopsis acidicola]KAA9160516.1 phosphotransferase family protein [Amycolatopsis acidicola]